MRYLIVILFSLLLSSCLDNNSTTSAQQVTPDSYETTYLRSRLHEVQHGDLIAMFSNNAISPHIYQVENIDGEKIKIVGINIMPPMKIENLVKFNRDEGRVYIVKHRNIDTFSRNVRIALSRGE